VRILSWIRFPARKLHRIKASGNKRHETRKEKRVDINDIVVNGWGSRVAQAAYADPEMRVLVARVIAATSKLLKASSRELAAAIEEQNDAIAALKNHAPAGKLERQSRKSELVTELS
jgi:hypothetical protein